MAKKLTAGVLNGTAFKETMTIEWNGEEFEVEIRPLSNKEAIQVEAQQQEGINIKAVPAGKQLRRTMAFDAKANFRGRRKADILAVALGTTDKSITKEVVENEFPPKIVSEIAERIKEISGILTQEELEEMGKDTFRDE